MAFRRCGTPMPIKLGWVHPLIRKLDLIKMNRLSENLINIGRLARAEIRAWKSGKRMPKNSNKALFYLGQLPSDVITDNDHQIVSILRNAEVNGWQVSAMAEVNKLPLGPKAQTLINRIPPYTYVIRLSWEGSTNDARKTIGTLKRILACYQMSLTDHPPEVIVISTPNLYGYIAAFLFARRVKAKFILDFRGDGNIEHFCKAFENGIWKLLYRRRLIKKADGIVFSEQSQFESAQHAIKDVSSDRVVILSQAAKGLDQNRESAADYSGELLAKRLYAALNRVCST